LSAQ